MQHAAEHGQDAAVNAATRLYSSAAHVSWSRSRGGDGDSEHKTRGGGSAGRRVCGRGCVPRRMCGRPFVPGRGDACHAPGCHGPGLSAVEQAPGRAWSLTQMSDAFTIEMTPDAATARVATARALAQVKSVRASVGMRLNATV